MPSRVSVAVLTGCIPVYVVLALLGIAMSPLQLWMRLCGSVDLKAVRRARAADELQSLHACHCSPSARSGGTQMPPGLELELQSWNKPSDDKQPACAAKLSWVRVGAAIALLEQSDDTNRTTVDALLAHFSSCCPPVHEDFVHCLTSTFSSDGRNCSRWTLSHLMTQHRLGLQHLPRAVSDCERPLAAARFMLAHGASVHPVLSATGGTALHVAATARSDGSCRSAGLIKLLLEHGADASLGDRAESTPLVLALWHGCLPTARELLRLSAASRDEAAEDLPVYSYLATRAFFAVNCQRMHLADLRVLLVDLAMPVDAVDPESSLEFDWLRDFMDDEAGPPVWRRILAECRWSHALFLLEHSRRGEPAHNAVSSLAAQAADRDSDDGSDVVNGTALADWDWCTAVDQSSGSTVLHYAAMSGENRRLEYFAQRWRRCLDMSAHGAVAPPSGHPFLDASRSPLLRGDRWGCQPMHAAAERGSLRTVRWLLRRPHNASGCAQGSLLDLAERNRDARVWLEIDWPRRRYRGCKQCLDG